MTGYLRDKQDERDFRYGTPLAAVLPDRCSLESVIGPTFDQGNTEECVCFSLAAIMRYQEFLKSSAWLSFDENDLYALCKASDGDPQPGTYPRTALQVAQQQGLLGSDGQRYRIASYTRLGSLVDIKHSIAIGFPVILGLEIDQEELSNAVKGEIVGPASNVDGGHCMVAVGYDDEIGALRIRNSWGVSWCDDGHFWLAYNYLDTDPNFDAWQAVGGS